MLSSIPRMPTYYRALFSKLFCNQKVTRPSWRNQSSQFTRLSCCPSINTSPFIFSNSEKSQLRNTAQHPNVTLSQRRMNLHQLSTEMCADHREMWYNYSTAISSGCKLFPNKNMLANNCRLNNRIPSRWSSSKPNALMVISELKELKTAPMPALVLGFSGLIPFVSAPAYMIMTSVYMPDLSFAQTAYGAIILSFLGGVRWGHALSNENALALNWTSLGQSVVPSLVAWPALLLPAPFSTLVVATGLGTLAYFDIVSSIYTPWFKALRFVLSFVAVIALWSSIMCYLLKPQPPQKQK